MVNYAYHHWKTKGGPINVVVHVSFPTMYPRYDEMFFNPAVLEHLTDRFEDRFIPSPTDSSESMSTPISIDITILVNVIKEGVDSLRNNKPTAPINAHSLYVTFGRTSLPSDVMI